MSGRLAWFRSRFRLVVASGLVLSIVLGSIGQLTRDRSVILALLMYLPLPLLGFVAMVFDTICRGRALPKGRFILGGMGSIALIASSLPMIGSGPVSTNLTGPEISLLHWNVLWGGGRPVDPAKWASIRREILAQAVDLVVLSEAPGGEWLDQLVNEMGPGASSVQVEHEPGATAWYKLVVCSKGSLRLVRREPVTEGAGMVVEAEVRGRTLRLLVIDAKSNPLLSRTPRLLDMAAACRRASDSGAPIDVIVGDFNTVSRSLGFDAIEAEGYALASRSSWGWRATFPSFLPVYDIDHVWVRRALPVIESHLFTNFASDHRGQVARLMVPE
jgi:endonuclease/exonuclease/phosphatase (EEP) superfamily protein YafD